MKTLVGFWACLLSSSVAAAQTATVEVETEQDDLEVPAATPGPAVTSPAAPSPNAPSAAAPSNAVPPQTTPPPTASAGVVITKPEASASSATGTPVSSAAASVAAPPAAASAAVPAPVAPTPPPTGSEKAATPAVVVPAAAAVSAPQTPVSALGGFGVHAPSSALGLRFSGFVQGQYQLSQLSENQLDSSGAPLNRSEFSLRRGRFRVDQGWQYAGATLELDANSVRGLDIGVRRAFASLLHRQPEGATPVDSHGEAPIAALHLGVVDVPFGYEMLESPLTRAFMERGPASRALFPSEAELGVSAVLRFGYLRVNAALVNGEVSLQKGYTHTPNSAPELVIRIGGDTTRPSQDWGARAGVSFAKGKGFHAGLPATKDTLQWVDINSDGAVAANETVGVPGSAATVSKNFDRWVLGLDAGGFLESSLGRTSVYAEVYLASNHDRAVAVADPVAAGRDVREAGVSAGISHLILGRVFAGLQLGVYDSDSDVIVERRGELLGASQTTWTWAPVVGAQLPGNARLSAEYDFISDHLARSTSGVPKDSKNNTFTIRLEARL